MRSNVAIWQALQEADYFDRHPRYEQGRLETGAYDIETIGRFCSIEPHHVVVVIGCGYGRESAFICKRAALVYGVDVSDKILARASAHLSGTHRVTNFRPVLAEKYATDIPSGIDLVYSVTVMQHLTRDLVCDYLQTLGGKLAPAGRMLIQFLEYGVSEPDASVSKVYEPTVSWTPDQIKQASEAAGLVTLNFTTDAVRPGCAWHWACLGRA